MKYDVIIIGSGAAGLSAAIYLSRAGVKTLVLGDTKSSQLTAAFGVENYFGFPEGIAGTKLLKLGRQHAEKHGAKIVGKKAVEIKKESDFFTIKLEDNTFHEADYLLIATGLLSPLDFCSSLKLQMDKKLLKVNHENQTSHEKVYAAGNCCTQIRQIAKDVGDGCNAAINIIKKVKNLPHYVDYGPVSP